jgi:dTMP kinase
MFIVLEGIDGTGKSTQAQQLGDWLRDRGHEVIVDFEPTFGPHGQKLRDSFVNGRLAAEEELELFLADRREHVYQVIAPALAAGKTVILDRYYFSNMAYQGAIGFDPAEIRRQNEDFAPVPDFLFILDLDVATALSRIGGRGDTANEFEKRENLERCREIFLSLKAEPFARVIDTRGTMEDVQSAIRAEISGISFH